MPFCPNQHASESPDFCAVCGVEIPAEAGGVSTREQAGAVGERCPACHTEHDVSVGNFCEACGYNFKTGAHPPPTEPPQHANAAPAAVSDSNPGNSQGLQSPVGEAVEPPVPPDAPPVEPSWELIVSVVRNPHMGMPDADPLPVRADEAFPLLGDRVTIGRHSARRQITPDLSLDHDDGVSHRHVELSRTPEAGFSLADLGSSNGTTVNGTEVPAGTSVLLRDGDSIALGRWTKLTVRRTAVPAPGNGAGTLVDLPNAG